MNKVESGIEL